MGMDSNWYPDKKDGKTKFSANQDRYGDTVQGFEPPYCPKCLYRNRLWVNVLGRLTRTPIQGLQLSPGQYRHPLVVA